MSLESERISFRYLKKSIWSNSSLLAGLTAVAGIGQMVAVVVGLMVREIDKSNPEYKGDWNMLGHNSRLYTPDDTTIQTINSDTLYSFIGVDVRDELIVITVPQSEDVPPNW